MLFALYSEAADYQDFRALGYHFEVCNSCDGASNFRDVALKSNPDNGLTVVANLNTGQIYSYTILREYEPGYGDDGWVSDALVSPTPASAISAVSDVREMFNQMDILANKHISRDNPILSIYIDEVTLGVQTPSVTTILGNSTAGDAVSSYIRLKTLVGLQDYASAAFKILVLKLNITVTTIFPDGSKLDWFLHNPLESKRPYKIIRGSAKGKNGQNISDTHLPIPSGVNYESYNNYDNYNNRWPGIRQTCITYTVKYSFGQIGYSIVCFVSY